MMKKIIFGLMIVCGVQLCGMEKALTHKKDIFEIPENAQGKTFSASVTLYKDHDRHDGVLAIVMDGGTYADKTPKRRILSKDDCHQLHKALNPITAQLAGKKCIRACFSLNEYGADNDIASSVLAKIRVSQDMEQKIGIMAGQSKSSAIFPADQTVISHDLPFNVNTVLFTFVAIIAYKNAPHFVWKAMIVKKIFDCLG